MRRHTGVKTMPRREPAPPPPTLDDRIRELAQRCKLDSWRSFVDELQVPSELVPALMANRAEMVRIAPTRDMTADEVKILYSLIGGLLETNAALREHAQQLAQLVGNWQGAFKASASIAAKIDAFANFKHTDIAYDDDDERGGD